MMLLKVATASVSALRDVQRAERAVGEHQQKVALVVLADAAADPGAVVVHTRDARRAGAAVVHARPLPVAAPRRTSLG